RRGAHEGELVSLLSASGAMSETIPPSLVLITIGSVTGVSIAALFTGGLLPAAVLAVALAVIEGIATATEVSTIGIAYAVVVGALIYRQFPLRRLFPMLVETAALSGAILLIIGTATGMAWALTQSGFSHQLAQSMAAMPGGAAGFMAVSIVAFVVLGSVLEGIPAIVLFGPLLLGIGLFAPPFGVGYYAACAIGRVSPDAAMRRIWPYLAAVLVGLIVVAAVPWFSNGFL
ncbi:MAG: TRAP transporter large permease subunit, partial [Rhodospirillales bacterium]|nr:TRAP transporter large permease subunit [Rhodospirillales bacterium]